jgi:hypothetical protein
MTMLTMKRSDANRFAMRRMILLLPLGLASACIQVKAPDKPIEINLNVNIRQEVVVSLRDDVKNLDPKFPGVF